MWGTLSLCYITYIFRRFIPTHVGSTISVHDIDEFITVHPHACGEHDKFTHEQVIKLGSSPRMWGAL